MTISAGWSTIDITPDVGTDMGGYWARPGASVGIHDELRGSVLLFEDATQRVGIISLDLVGLDASHADELRQCVAAQIGMSPDNLLLCSTHTHSGPLSLSFRGMGETPSDYLDSLAPRLMQAARTASERLEPCELSTASATADLAINRRAQRPGALHDGMDPEQLVPSQAHALHIETSRGRALLVHYPCHPVVLGGANQLISAEWPGVMVRHIEATANIDLALFVNGACGDLNPKWGNADFDKVEEAGLIVGEAVISALPSATKLDASDVAASFERIELPLMEPPGTLRTAAGASVDALKLAIKKAAFSDNMALRRVPEARLAWARQLMSLDHDTPKTQPFAIQGIRIGDLRLIGLEGEIFARYQMDLEANHPSAWLCGYAGGCVGYIPTADEYDRGGYEIDEAYKVYPSVLMVAPESEIAVRQAIERTLATMR